MTFFQLAGLLLSLTALLAWLNRRVLGLPATIGVMLLALACSLLAQAAMLLGVDIAAPAGKLVDSIDFSHTLLDGMLGALLFAGALQVDLRDLVRQGWVVAVLATLGLGLSTLIVGTLLWLVFVGLGIALSPLYCYVFGAIISPTDPIAVLAILRRAGVPRTLEAQFVGESLFNDAVAIVLFLVLSQVAGSQGDFALTPAHIAQLFATEALGGIGFGVALGGFGFVLLYGINDYKTEVLVTLALVVGGYASAEALHTSGPLAMVTAGLMVGHHGRGLAMSAQTRQQVDTFWELVDEILNTVLFVLIGLELLHIHFTWNAVIAGLASIPIILGARLVAVGAPITALRPWHDFAPHTIKILTWGGLRGGISVALALSLPDGPARDLIVNMTYIVVLFSIGVQGLSIGRVAELAGAKR